MRSSPRRTGPLCSEGIVVVDAELKEGRLLVEVTGAPDERVRQVVGERFGPSTRVTVVDDLPRRLYARPSVGHMEREEKRLQFGLRDVFDGVTGLHVPFKNVWAEMGPE